MKLNVLTLVLVVAVLGSVTTVQAAVFFDFTYTHASGGQVDNGQLTADYNIANDGSYTVVSGVLNITGGTYQGSYSLFANPIAPSIATSPSGIITYNDQLMPSSNPKLSSDGLLFTGGSTEINFYSSGGAYALYAYDPSASGIISLVGTFDLTVVPEPINFVLSLFGLVFIIGGVGRLYVKKQRLAA